MFVSVELIGGCNNSVVSSCRSNHFLIKYPSGLVFSRFASMEKCSSPPRSFTVEVKDLIVDFEILWVGCVVFGAIATLLDVDLIKALSQL